MDLSNLISDESVEIVIRHPGTGADLIAENGEPVTIRIFGRDSEVFRNHQKSVVNKRLQQSNRKAAASVEQMEIDAINTLAACIAGWTNIDVPGKAGMPLEYNRSNARLLVSKVIWLREQIDEAIGDRANFLQASEKT